MALRLPNTERLAVHPHSRDIIQLDDIFAVASIVDRKGVRVGRGLESSRRLLAFFFRLNLLWTFNLRLPFIPLAIILRNIQDLKGYHEFKLLERAMRDGAPARSTKENPSKIKFDFLKAEVLASFRPSIPVLIQILSLIRP
jgi:hypothetical protein